MGIGEGTRDSAQASVKPQLAHYDELGRQGEIALPRSGNDADGDGQVIAAAVLAQVSRGEVDDNFLSGDVVPKGFQRRCGAQQAFLDSGICQPDKMNAYAALDSDLDKDLDRLDSKTFCSSDVCQHFVSILYLCLRYAAPNYH